MALFLSTLPGGNGYLVHQVHPHHFGQSFMCSSIIHTFVKFMIFLGPRPLTNCAGIVKCIPSCLYGRVWKWSIPSTWSYLIGIMIVIPWNSGLPHWIFRQTQMMYIIWRFPKKWIFHYTPWIFGAKELVCAVADVWGSEVWPGRSGIDWAYQYVCEIRCMHAWVAILNTDKNNDNQREG